MNTRTMQHESQSYIISSASQSAPNNLRETAARCGAILHCFNKRVSWILLLVTITFTLNTIAQDTTTIPWKLVANVSGNANLHSASFAQLPGIPNCCVQFTGGVGTGLSIGAGAEYLSKKTILGLNYRVGALLRYSTIGAPLTETNFFANIIVGNSVQQGTSQHSLDASFSLLSAEPYILVQPTSLPLHISLGLEAGTFIGATYAQKETLLTPSNAVFETGSTIRNEKSGDIPNASSLFLGLNLSARYDVYSTESLTLSPEIGFTYGFTKLVSSLEWKASVLRAGITAQYQLRKSVPVIVVPPPAPPPPPVPPAPKKLSITTFNAVYNNQPIKSNETVIVEVPATEHLFKTVLVPKVYYTKTTTQLIPEQNSVIDALIQQCISDTTLRVNISGSAAPDEDKLLAQQRAESVAAQLRSSGINSHRISISTSTKAPSAAARYPELLEEMRCITLALSNVSKRNQPIVLSKSDTVSNMVLPSEVRVYTSYTSDTTITDATLGVNTNGNTTTTRANEENYIKLSPESLGALFTQNIALSLNVRDGAGNTKSDRMQFTIQPKRTVTTTLHNIVNTDNGNVHEWIVGYCDFDKPTFYQINSEVFPEIREYAAKGRKVELIALTDNLGTTEHNEALAQSRAQESMRLIGLTNNQVTVTLKPSGVHTNTTPMGRSMNRAVVIRIAVE